MDIRNLMEDKVLQTVNEICDEEEQSGRARYNTTYQCRMDVACYVLNRIPQRYVTSGRGFAYLESDLNENMQIQVDIVRLVSEGLQRVSEVARSFYIESTEDRSEFPAGTLAIYYFPTIKGRIFNALTFEPLVDLQILLKMNESTVRMVDGRWPNPYSIVGNTAGTYLFWPQSLAAKEPGETRIFDFTLEIHGESYDPFVHFFSIPIAAEAPRAQKKLVQDYSVSDIFLIPRGQADNDMQLNPSENESL